MQKSNTNGMNPVSGMFRSVCAAAAVIAVTITGVVGTAGAVPVRALAAGDSDADVVLRVCNWEEHIDL